MVVYDIVMFDPILTGIADASEQVLLLGGGVSKPVKFPVGLPQFDEYILDYV
jgi:hypothetical protein